MSIVEVIYVEVLLLHVGLHLKDTFSEIYFRCYFKCNINCILEKHHNNKMTRQALTAVSETPPSQLGAFQMQDFISTKH